MRDIDVLKYTERNAITEAEHHKQVFWQITIPFIVGLLLILIAGGLVITAAVGGVGQVRVWADISLIWLIVPALLITLLMTAILGAITYGVVKLIGALPTYTYKLQHFLASVRVKIRAASDTAAKPVISVESWVAALRRLLRF